MTLRYQDGNGDRRRVDRANAGADQLKVFIPPVDRDAIFQELIRQEVRYGRLNRAARARIVKYACGMGLSARQAGKLIHTCREAIARERRHAPPPRNLRVIRAEPSPRGRCRVLAWLAILAVSAVAVLLRQRWP